MARVRTAEEVEEIKVREKIKLSLVRQQLELNRLIGTAGCPTARGKVYITSIFQKDGQLSISRPHLALECQIRQHLNQKDVRMRRRAIFEPRLEEPDIREYCACKTFKEKCPAFRRFIEETDSVIVKRQLPQGVDTVPTLKIDAAPRETLEPVKAPKPESAAAAPPASTYSTASPHGHGPQRSAGYNIYQRKSFGATKADPHGVHGHQVPPQEPGPGKHPPKPGERHRGRGRGR